MNAVALSPAEIEILRACRKDGAPPHEIHVADTHRRLEAAGLLDRRVGKTDDGDEAEFWSTNANGEWALRVVERRSATGGRVVHCKRERYDVYIGRPSPFGNPFPVPSKDYDRDADPENILGRYEAYVRSRPDLMAALPGLRGKVLGCWCAPKRCHGDVLLKLIEEVCGGR